MHEINPQILSFLYPTGQYRIKISLFYNLKFYSILYHYKVVFEETKIILIPSKWYSINKKISPHITHYNLYTHKLSYKTESLSILITQFK